MFQIKAVEKSKHNFIFNNFFSSKFVPFMR